MSNNSSNAVIKSSRWLMLLIAACVVLYASFRREHADSSQTESIANTDQRAAGLEKRPVWVPAKGTTPSENPPSDSDPSVLFVRDIFGGEIEGASVTIGGELIGQTNARGQSPPLDELLKGRLKVTANGYAPAWEMYRPGFTREVVLSPESTISGTVQFGDTHTPASGIRVYIGSSMSVVTGGNGKFSFDGLGPSTYSVSARGNGQVAKVIQRSVGIAEHVTGLVLNLEPGHYIRGRLLVPEALDAGQFTVSLDRQNWEVDSNGDFKIPGVASGKHHLYTVRRDNRQDFAQAAGTRWVEIVDEDVFVEIDLRSRTQVDIVVTGPGNTPQSGLSLQGIQTANRSRVRRNCRTDNDGQCSFTGVSKGEFVIRPHMAGVEETSVDILGERTQQVHISLDNSYASIEGKVVDFGGVPLAELVVFAKETDGDMQAIVKTAEDGSFRTQFLPLGSRYEVTVLRERKPISTENPALAVQLVSLTTPQGGEDLRLVANVARRLIRGTVRDMQGQGVADATVTYHPSSPDYPARWFQFFPGREVVVTDANGRFVLKEVRDIDVVSLEARSGANKQSRRVEVGPGFVGEVELSLVNVGSLVLDTSQLSLEDCRFSVYDGDGLLGTRHVSLTRPTRFKPLPAGTFESKFSCGGDTATGSVSIEAGREQTVSLGPGMAMGGG